MPRSARIYATLVVGAGVLAAWLTLWHWESIGSLRFAVYLALTLAATVIKVRLPGITSTYSPAALFLLFGVAYLSPAETMLAGCVSGVLQCLWKPKKRPNALQVAFSTASIALSMGACLWLAATCFQGNTSHPDVLVLFAAVYFIVNSLTVAGILSLLMGKTIAEVSEQSYLEWFPYYVAGAALVGLLPIGKHHLNPESFLILPPLLYLTHFYAGLSLRKANTSTPRDPEGDERLPRSARLYASAMVSAGSALLLWSLMNWQTSDAGRFLAYFAAAAILATWKVRLPAMTGTLSLHYVVLLVAIAGLQPGETFLIAAVGATVQSVWKPKIAPKPFQVAFNISALTIASGLAYLVSRVVLAPFIGESVAMLLAVSTTLLYAADTLMVAVILTLIEARPLSAVWRNCHFWSFPYFLVGTAGSGVMLAIARTLGWAPSLLILPILGLIYVSYRLHLRNAMSATA